MLQDYVLLDVLQSCVLRAKASRLDEVRSDINVIRCMSCRLVMSAVVTFRHSLEMNIDRVSNIR